MQKLAQGSLGPSGSVVVVVGGVIVVVVVVMISLTVFGQLLKAGMLGPDGKQFGSPFISG